MVKITKFRADTSGLEADAKSRSTNYSAKADADRPKVSSPTPAPTKAKSSGQSFRDAFREARVHGDKTFRWGSKSFTTDRASDKPKPKAPSAPAPTPAAKPKAASTPAPASKPAPASAPKSNTPAPGNAGKINTGPAAPLSKFGPVGAPPAAPTPAMRAMMGGKNNFSPSRSDAPTSKPPLTPRQRATQYTDPSRMADTNKYPPCGTGGAVKAFAKGGATYPIRMDISKKAAPAKPDNRPAPPITQKALDGYARSSAAEEAGDSKVLKTKKFAKGGATSGFGPHTEKSTSSKMPTPFKAGKPGKAKVSADGKAPIFSKGKPSTKGKSTPPPFVKGTMPSFAKGGRVDGIAVRGKTRAMKRGGKC